MRYFRGQGVNEVSRSGLEVASSLQSDFNQPGSRISKYKHESHQYRCALITIGPCVARKAVPTSTDAKEALTGGRPPHIRQDVLPAALPAVLQIETTDKCVFSLKHSTSRSTCAASRC